MPSRQGEKLTRIGVFYDGNYFLHVSNFYNYVHDRKSRFSIKGLHEFIRHQVAQEENSDPRFCQIVDAHYFRGRLTAREAREKDNQLFYDRVFDDVLMSEGVNTHYLPIKTYSGIRQEKGIDVWLALEAYEKAFNRRFDVLVLVASDGDYAPLIRKLNALGTRVMVLSWDFDYTDEDGKKYSTRTSQNLLEEVTYPIAMHEIIDNRIKRNDPLINSLFVHKEHKGGGNNGNGYYNKPMPRSYGSSNNNNPPASAGLPPQQDDEPLYELEGEIMTSTILSLKEGYGFIKFEPNNVFFHYKNLMDDFNDLREGATVEFQLEISQDSKYFARNVKILSTPEDNQPLF